MKKILISAMLLLAGFGVNAQLLEVNSMQRVNMPEGMYVAIPTISPDGSYVVVSDLATDGLTKISLDGSAPVTVCTNGNGLDVRFSADGKQVIFRQSTVDRNHLRKTALKSVDLTTGKETQIVAPSRNLNAGIAVEGNTVTAVENGRAKVRRLGTGSSTAAPVVSINYGHLTYTANGKTVTLDPQGRGSYIWPTLSPDGSKIAYYLSGGGCYVCNTDGSNPIHMGELRAAKWLDNNTLVGMKDTDNGEFTTASEIVAVNLQGTRQVLTTDSHVAMYPSASADGKKIAFSTPAGELYIINIK